MSECRSVGVSECQGDVGVSGIFGCRECRGCRSWFDTFDTRRTWALSGWPDTGLTLVSECRAQCRLTLCRSVGRVSGECRDRVSECQARAQTRVPV